MNATVLSIVNYFNTDTDLQPVAWLEMYLSGSLYLRQEHQDRVGNNPSASLDKLDPSRNFEDKPPLL